MCDYAITMSTLKWQNIMAPPKKDTEALTLRLGQDMIHAIDTIRRNEKDIPTRPEMIRRILQAWIEQNPPRG
jgi:metal-responsive CopG/Arc/MetJ family transcriptional regulator